MNAPRDVMREPTDIERPDENLVIANVSRRRFLGQMSALSGLVLAAGFPVVLRAEEKKPRKYGVDNMPHGWVDDPLVFVAIAEDGTVSIVCHRNGIATNLQILPDDLGIVVIIVHHKDRG